MKELYDELCVGFSKKITKRYSSSFSLGIYLLNRGLRNPIYAIYGFVRLADEIVDSFHAYDKTFLLQKFKQDTFQAIEQGISLNPIIHAFQSVVNHYHIDLELIELFLNSMEMDLCTQQYTSEKYKTYILGSAEVVGLMCLTVFVNGNTERYNLLKPYAMKLGSAFQKVNFLRDVKADHELLKRNYFPGIDLNSFSDQEKIKIQEEVEDEFKTAYIGIKELPKSCRIGVYVAYVYYKRLFYKIKKASTNRIMSERIRISNGNKIGLMLLSVVKYKLGRI